MRITLCGSTKFKKQFEEYNAQLSLDGHAVYSCGLWGHSGDELTGNQKLMLDAVHMAKIQNSDAIFVINIDDYIGESTRREIFFAITTGKEVMFAEDCNHPDIVSLLTEKI